MESSDVLGAPACSPVDLESRSWGPGLSPVLDPRGRGRRPRPQALSPGGSRASEKPPQCGREGGGEHSLGRRPAGALSLRCSLPPPVSSSPPPLCPLLSGRRSLLASPCLWSLPPSKSPSCSWSLKAQRLPVTPSHVPRDKRAIGEKRPRPPRAWPWLPLQPRLQHLSPRALLQLAALHLAHWPSPSSTRASGSPGDDPPRRPRQSPG